MEDEPCPICSLQTVVENGQLITRVNWKKNLLAPSPCPECMRRAGEHFAAFGERVAKKMNDAFWEAFANRPGG